MYGSGMFLYLSFFVVKPHFMSQKNREAHENFPISFFLPLSSKGEGLGGEAKNTRN